MNWLHKINIKQFLSDDDSKEEVARVRELVAVELEKAKPFQQRYNADGAYLVEEVRRAQDCDEFNSVLAQVYDHADAHCVWLGLRVS